MLNNNLYNLMMQMTVEHLSIWRIKKYYIKDAKNNKSLQRFWRELLIEKEKNIHRLKHLIEENLK